MAKSVENKIIFKEHAATDESPEHFSGRFILDDKNEMVVAIGYGSDFWAGMTRLGKERHVIREMIAKAEKGKETNGETVHWPEKVAFLNEELDKYDK